MLVESNSDSGSVPSFSSKVVSIVIILQHTKHSVGSSRPFIPTLFVVLILATIITVTALPRALLIVPIGVIAIFSVYLVRSGLSRLYVPVRILIAINIIYVVYILHAITNPSDIELVSRVFIFIPASFILLFLIPSAISKRLMLRVISCIAGGVALLGIPSAFIGDSYPFVSVQLTSTAFGVEFYMIESLLSNPNPLGELLFMGVLSSLVWTKKPQIRWGLFSICIVGLFFTQSRAAFLGLAAGITVYVVGNMVNQKQFHRFILFSLALGTTGYLMLLRLIPGPAVIEQVHLAGRLDIWYAAIDAVKARPLFGHGPGDMPTIVGTFASGSVGAGVYNSFIRMFVTTGVIGGLCYLYLFLYSITAHAKVIASRESLLIHALLIGFVVNELFSGNSIFGLSTTSVVGALVIGFMLRDVIDNGSKTLRDRSSAGSSKEI